MLETVLFHALLCAGFLPLAISLWKRGARAGACGALGLWAATALWAASSLHPAGRPEPEPADRPVAVEELGYVSSDTCRACHPEHYASWHASYHRTMTQAASPEAIVAPFDGRTVRFDGLEYRVEREGERFYIEMPDQRMPAPDAPRVREEVVMLTGSHHEQDFWYATGEGRSLRRFPIVYRIAEDRWVPNESVFLQPPAARHGLGAMPQSEWNVNCVKCHATHGRPGFRMDGTPAADTEVAELGIACEACHGPAEEHVARYGNPLARYRQHFSDEADSSIVDPQDLTASRSSVVCGQCHSITAFDDLEARNTWLREGTSYRPGNTLEEAQRFTARSSEARSRPAMRQKLRSDPLFLEQRFWDDGTVRVSGREYNGLLESPCYRDGSHADDMSCLSCHQMHQRPDDPRSVAEWNDDQLGPGMDGDQACLQCHEDVADDLEGHTHHPEGSAGSRCYNCHMPFTTFGLLKGIRSHRVDAPNVHESLAARRPNACNLCHLDQSRAWAAEHLTAWYDQPALTVDDPALEQPAGLVWTLRGDAGVRALLAWHMGWHAAQTASGTEWMGAALAELLLDPYDAVRFNAGRSLGSLPGFGDLEYDFVGPRAERSAALERVLARLRELELPSTPGECFDALDPREAEALRRARDQRAVHLRE